MKKSFLLIMALCSIAFVSACVVGDKPGNGPDHCPPGHHMKGWC
ncbi:MAG: hypothetical protein ACXW30_05880 [Micavibrio sp.]